MIVCLKKLFHKRKSTTVGSARIAAKSTRRARGADGNRRGCGTSVCGGSSRLAVVGGWQVNGRTDDFARCGTASTGWRARIDIFWFSTSPAQPAGNETSGPPGEGFGADAVHAGNARYTCRSQVVASGLREARVAGDVAHL